MELHVYPEGIHGLSLANELVECLDGRGVQEECTSWISLVDTWLGQTYEERRRRIMSKRPTVLMILDGYGLNNNQKGNAVAEAKTPVVDKLMAEYPFVKRMCKRTSCRLPDGQMGNSEVGHLNMGAGRIVYQELTKITKSIQDGDFFENKALLAGV